jgi:hypothetical protein
MHQIPGSTTSSTPATRQLASTGYGTHLLLAITALFLGGGLMFLGFDFIFAGQITRLLRKRKY